MAAGMVLQVVVSPFLGVLFDNVGSLIRKEVGRVWGVDKELEKLATTLSTIRDVLEDAENKQIADKAVAKWLRKLRDLAYDADDILEEWDMEARELRLGTEDVACSKQVCLSYFSCFNFAQVAFRRKIAKKVNDLREKFDEINLERSAFHLSVGIVGRRLDHYQNRETSSLPTDPDVYGRDEEKNFMVTCLLNNTASEEGVSVHPIVGIGGLGKTTLAQVCYNDQRVLEHFDVRIWVCVSDDFDVKRLTKAVIISIGGDVKNIEDLDPLQRLLEIKLVQKRFLLVLDDVWNDNQEEWSRFKNSLRCGARGSSIIVTTRLKTVASITGTHDPLFLKLLSEDDCWSLFRVRAFGMGNNESPNLMQIGQEIVGKCGGVPLVAKVLGGLLRFKHSEKEWLNIRDSRIWELPQSDGNTILPAMRLSYIHLAPHLRQCFAYCAVFPKDHVMEKNVLIRLWMANGFIQSNREMQMEDIGDEIFNELSWRSLFQNEEKNEDGVVVSCMMHDLIHDLACSINEDECCRLDDDSTLIRDVNWRTRHLSIACKNKSSPVFGSIYERAPNLRTLLLLSDGSNNKFATEICMKSLRVLYLKRNIYRFEVKRELLVSLCNLKHLRYLHLSGSDVKLLPESLCQLRNLQTLELEGCYELEKLPEEMGKMISLRHLNIKGCFKLNEMPVGMGKLIWLHTLSWFIVSPGEGRGIKELQELENLCGKIKIKGLEHVKTKEEAKEANLMGKPNLVSLRLSWDSSDVMVENHQNILESLQPHPSLRKLFIKRYKGLTFPNWLDSLQSLVEISIFECSGCEHLPSALGTLPLLRRLDIREMNSLKFFFNDDNVTSAYPSLTYLKIVGAEELEDWFPRGIRRTCVIHLFPCLQELIISDCPKLKTLPPSSSSLQTLRLWSGCNPAILGSIQNLPSLSSLRIEGINDIIRFPEESLQNLPSLKSLQIHGCESLLSLPSLMGTTSLTDMIFRGCRSLTNVSLALRHQTSLQRLAISGCPKAEISAVEYQHLTSLRDLTIIGIHELTNLPDGLQHLSSSTLESLLIASWYALNSLPDWIGSFTNLKRLSLEYCWNLRSLPDGIQQLTNLEYLWIQYCHPELHGRCEKHTGEDWPRIKHIPRIDNMIPE